MLPTNATLIVKPLLLLIARYYDVCAHKTINCNFDCLYLQIPTSYFALPFLAKI